MSEQSKSKIEKTIEYIRRNIHEQDSSLLFCLIMEQREQDPQYKQKVDRWLEGLEGTVYLRDVVAAPFETNQLIMQMHLITAERHPYIAPQCRWDNIWLDLDTMRHNFRMSIGFYNG